MIHDIRHLTGKCICAKVVFLIFTEIFVTSHIILLLLMLHYYIDDIDLGGLRTAIIKIS